MNPFLRKAFFRHSLDIFLDIRQTSSDFFIRWTAVLPRKAVVKLSLLITF